MYTLILNNIGVVNLKRIRGISFIVILITFFFLLAGNIHNTMALDAWSIAPVTKKGKTWRIGYCESEPYINYAGIFYSTIRGLGESGWIRGDLNGIPFTEGQKDTSEIWKWLAERDLGRYLTFPGDAHYIFNQMTLSPGQQPQDVIVNRINQKKDIDILIVMGEAAGVALANANCNIPIMVFGCNNAVEAGIIKSATDPGKDNIWAHMDPLRYRRQLQIFHDIFKFNKLGVVYENTNIGEGNAALDDIKYESSLNNFKLECETVNTPTNDADLPRYYNDLNNAYESLSKQVDAFYLTANEISPDKLSQLLTSFTNKNIPVFSATGSEDVRNGALVSLTPYDFPNVGRFAAESIERVLKGVSLKNIPQVYESTPEIILNLKIANMIKYKPPFEVLLSADQIFN